MTTRREAREWVLQILFQLDFVRDDALDAVFARFWEDKSPDAPARRFAEELVVGVRAHLSEIDPMVIRHAEHWDLSRMGAVERNVLRTAVYEMVYRGDIPPAVSINEAVDIAKFFGSSESGRFVNGILDCIRKQLDRPPRQVCGGPAGRRRREPQGTDVAADT